MFHRWGFLLGEIWVLLALAALLGLFVGWLIWGRRSAVTVNTGEADGLRASLDACNAKGRDQAARIAALEADVKAANTRAQDAHLAAENARADAKAADEAAKAAAAKTASAAPASMAAPLMAAAPVKAEAKPKAAPKPKAEAKPKADAKPKAAAKAKEDDKTPSKPAALKAARGGKPDDLKLIKGIGPKLEILCHKLGFFHFDQLANWTAKEIAWVDENLEGFEGRVTRDEWVQQARDLMNGLPPRPGGEN